MGCCSGDDAGLTGGVRRDSIVITKAKLVRIGNSRGVRLPKPLILEAGLGEDVDLHVHQGTIVIRPAGRIRLGWAESARLMSERGEDVLTDASPTGFDQSEWRWDG
jgi:antitoxin MazE